MTGVEHLKIGDPYIVYWYDALGVNGDWVFTEDDPKRGELKATVNKTIGWLHQRSSSAIKLVPHYGGLDNDRYSGDMVIPTICIKEIRPLETS